MWDNRLKDILTSDTTLLEYYLLRKGLQLALLELASGNRIGIESSLIPKAKGMVEDMLREEE